VERHDFPLISVSTRFAPRVVVSKIEISDEIGGIHHITAIASDPQRTLDFYTQVLGLRLVKLTVNFDDPGTYHFYFGDEVGSPGTILTFFPWPHVPPGEIGTGQVTTIAFEVPAASLEFWSKRLRDRSLYIEGVEERFGEEVVRFHDPDGLWLELVAVPHAADRPVAASGEIPSEQAIRGFHSATLLESDSAGTERLVAFMGFTKIGEVGDRIRYQASGRDASIVDIVRAPKTPRGGLGAGIVHHIAFRTPTDERQAQWRRELMPHVREVTPVIDRVYFHSIYFREPGGVLFEIATDPPGFLIDETIDHLGERLMLPPWLEQHRGDLERKLPPLTRRNVPVAR
jgi:glyoxalase family protein